MKALLVEEIGKHTLKLTDIAEPILTDDYGVKIRVKYCGICGSDAHTYMGTYPSTKPPVVLGHEFSGQVVEVGKAVKKVKVGQRVTSETTFTTCGTCPECQTKNYNLCSKRKGIGTAQNGAFAEYVVSREESVHILPDNVSYLTASLLEPLACSVHACLEKTTVHANDTVCIFGPGTIGLMLALVAKNAGAKVILAGVAKDQQRLELAETLGILTVNQGNENLPDFIARLKPFGVDLSYECSGSVHALNTAFEITKKRGDVVQMGVFSQDYNSINTQYILQKELNYIGSRSQKPSSWVKALHLLENEGLEVEPAITAIISLDEWKKGFNNTISSMGIKTVVSISDDMEP